MIIKPLMLKKVSMNNESFHFNKIYKQVFFLNFIIIYVNKNGFSRTYFIINILYIVVFI